MRTCLRFTIVLLAGLTAGLGAACGERLEPQQVAERFWTAVMAGDKGAVALFVTEASRAGLDPKADVIDIQAFSIGRTVIEDEQASVLTEVVIAADEPLSLPLETRLVLEEGHWRVDYERSVSPVASDSRLAGLIEDMRSMNRRFSDKVDESLAELQEAVPQIEKEFERLEDELKAAMPALQRAVEDFARRLEEALGGSSRPAPRSSPKAPDPEQHSI